MESKESKRGRYFFLFVLVIAAGLAVFALLLPVLSRAFSEAPEPGDVATQDYRAPEPITYESEVLTSQMRAASGRAVSPVYTAPDIQIARQQLGNLRSALEYITAVRNDDFATQQQKLEDLAALNDIQLSPETALTLLELPETIWQVVQQEALAVLERVMSNAIRSTNIATVTRQVPSMVSLSLPEDQSEVVAELVSGFVAPNSEFSESLTEEARQEAMESVEPVTRSFAVGQTVAMRGQVLIEEDIEALEQLRLIQPAPKWQNVLGSVVLVISLALFIGIYFNRQPDSQLKTGKSVLLITILFLITLFSARLTIPTHTVIPYAFPVAAYSLTVAALFGAEIAIASTIPLAILVAFGLPNALDLTIYYLLSSILGVLALGSARRIVSFIMAGTTVALAGIVVILAYRLPLPSMDMIGLATLTGAALFNGLASASIAFLLQFLLAQVLGMTTPMQLMDLTRPDHPLLQLLLREAPGTYQHSLQVANLAEQAAERINADPLLTRVGALYHDIGKTKYPAFFIENQVAGMPNPHDSLDPLASSQTIIRHVTDGLSMARKNRLPRRMFDFISEHHGTMITRYQYAKAVDEAGGDESQVDIEKFRYPGPKPQSRETAIIMMADGCEARLRAEKPINESEIRGLIRSMTDNLIEYDQLNETDLSLRDIDLINESFTATLRGVYHPRIKYPRDGGESDSENKTTPVSKDDRILVDDIPVDVSVDSSSPLP